MYTNQSVLANGNWYKIAIKESGIYKLDVPFLNSLGVNTSNLQSSSIRVFGNTGQMLGEANNAFKYDDLVENAVEVIDGGDGIFNNNDIVLFYGAGTDYWVKDSLNKRFTHQKSLYANESYYFINIQNGGRRIQNDIQPSTSNTLVNTYNERFFIEENNTNLLNSGKEWLGTELSNLPGRSLNKTFVIDVKNYIPNQAITLISNTVARSGATTRFDVSSNNAPIHQLLMPPVSGSSLDIFATQQQAISNFQSNQPLQNINYIYVPASGNAQGWINFLEMHTRCNLSMQNQSQLIFRDWNAVANGSIANYTITNTSNTIQVWDITNPIFPKRQVGNWNNGNFNFIQSANSLKEYIAFNNNNVLSPIARGNVTNQNLHNTQPIHYLIITNDALLAEAQRLANFHATTNNLQVKVVTINPIYNEFSGGIADVTAIKDFIKMYYDKYNTNPVKLQSVFLFGDASYDYLNRINNNTNFVPTWQSDNSFNPLLSYCSDDFFGYLDDVEDINGNVQNLLDIGIGRIPAKNIVEAKNFVDKVIQYHKTNTLGPWRNQITLIADDEDGNLHLNDAEVMSGTLNTVANTFIQDKIYLDAFRQESGSGGSRYPDVNNAINNKILDGTLIWNYSGHGGNSRLADEAILDVDMISNWNNEKKLPLFITATCDFAPYDDPGLQSIGENLVLQPKSGAIALMTTTRIVFAFSNRIINNNYLQIALQRNAAGNYNNLGEANKLAKNFTTINGGDIVNNRKFTLLGDPAMFLAYPKNLVRTTKINNKSYTPFVDTIKAASLVKIEGEILKTNQTLFNDFNGKIFVTVYDKRQNINTLANDATSVSTSFLNNGNILYKGSALVNNGKFMFDFIAPVDMQYSFGLGSISYYANNDTTDANGNDAIMVGGNGNTNSSDNIGPNIKAYLNDTKFVNGSLTNQSPILLVYLNDSSGINTSNIGVGHEITAVIDGNTRNTIILNDFYQADLNNFKKGSLQYALPKLSKGKHSIAIKAWDVFNNSSSYILECIVGDDEKLTIDKVYNYPNPFTTNTTFWFEHNSPNENLSVTITIFSISGKLVKEFRETINNQGNRSCDIIWDGKDGFGNKIASGVYVYQLKVENSRKQKQIKIEKLFKF